MAPSPHQRRLQLLRRYRNRPDPDLSLGFLKPFFRKEVENPHKQLTAMIELWVRSVPQGLADQCRLESLSRGVLRVAVTSSVWHYELDRLLRSGLHEHLIRKHRGPAFHRVQIRVDPQAVEQTPISKHLTEAQ